MQAELPRGAQIDSSHQNYHYSGGSSNSMSAVGWIAGSGGAPPSSISGGGGGASNTGSGGGGQIVWSEGLSRCWHRFVLEATCAQDLMEALVLLEASVIVRSNGRYLTNSNARRRLHIYTHSQCTRKSKMSCHLTFLLHSIFLRLFFFDSKGWQGLASAVVRGGPQMAAPSAGAPAHCYAGLGGAPALSGFDMDVKAFVLLHVFYVCISLLNKGKDLMWYSHLGFIRNICFFCFSFGLFILQSSTPLCAMRTPTPAPTTVAAAAPPHPSLLGPLLPTLCQPAAAAATATTPARSRLFCLAEASTLAVAPAPLRLL